jgi:uncharacterized membrane protein YeaQ/YmgE (transglycosylase-associated protein family)
MLGQLIVGNMGPEIFSIRVIPAFLGALIIVVVAELVTRSRSRRLV